MPELEAAVTGRDDAELVTVVVSGRLDHVKRAISAARFSGPVLLDRPGEGGLTLRRRYRIDQVPWTLTLDGQGRGAEVIVGGQNRTRFKRALDAVE